MIIAPDGLEYMPFQEAGIEWLIEHPRALLADQMGTGKTIQLCGVANALDPETVLVICPASAKDHWKRELEKWLLLCPSLGVIYGAERPKAKIIIINYDILHLHARALRSRYWDMIIIDEGHYVKDITSRRTKQVFGSRTLPPLRGKHITVLGGTPIVNRPIEMYPVLRYLDGPNWPSYDDYGEQFCGGRGGVVIHHFGSTELWTEWRKYCWNNEIPDSPVVQDGNNWGFFAKMHDTTKVKLTRLADYQGATNLGDLRERLLSIMLRRTKREVFPDLPDKVRRVISVDSYYGNWKEEQTDDSFESQLLELERGQLSEDQLATMRRETAERNLPVKIHYLDEAIEQDGKVVVFVHHKESVSTLRAHFKGRCCVVCGATPNKQRQGIVDRFQEDPKMKLFIGTKAAAEIYTLAAARRVVIAEPFWVPGLVEQMEDRLHRYPQTREVLVDHLAEEGTLDVPMAHAMVHKQNVIDRILN